MELVSHLLEMVEKATLELAYRGCPTPYAVVGFVDNVQAL